MLYVDKYERKASGRLGRYFHPLRMISLPEYEPVLAAFDDGRLTDYDWEPLMSGTCAAIGR